MGTQRAVAIPYDFEKRSDVRLLARALGGDAEKATLYAFRLWMDFAMEATDWRPLRGHADNADSHEWEKEDVTFLLESLAPSGVRSEGPGDGIRKLIQAGVLAVEDRDGLSGLVLAGFAKFNEHLLPGYLSIQQRGQRASVEARRRKDDAALAQQQRSILSMQGALPFMDGVAATEAEIDSGIALIMQLDRAAGRDARLSGDYDGTLVSEAVEVVRQNTPEQIEAVLNFILENRDAPAVIKRADWVLSHFKEYGRS